MEHFFGGESVTSAQNEFDCHKCDLCSKLNPDRCYFLPARGVRPDINSDNRLVEHFQLFNKPTGQQIGLEPLEADLLGILPIHTQGDKSDGCNSHAQKQGLL